MSGLALLVIKRSFATQEWKTSFCSFLNNGLYSSILNNDFDAGVGNVPPELGHDFNKSSI